MLFPVKQENRWGLINAEGQMMVSPRYDAIGSFERFGYATMQRNGGVGLLDQQGSEIVPPQFEDIKVLDSTLFAVHDGEAWRVIDREQQIVLQRGYEQVKVWEGPFLAFAKNGRWGVVQRDGTNILPARYDQVDYAPQDSCFYLVNQDQVGLADLRGHIILPPRAQHVERAGKYGFLYQTNNRWGLLGPDGQERLPAQFLSVQYLSDHYLKCYTLNGVVVWSFLCEQLIASDRHDDYFALSAQHLLIQEGQKVGLVNWCGRRMLSSRYREIQTFHGDWFRVRTDRGWQLVADGDSVCTDRSFDYIAPPEGPLSVVHQDGRYGMINVAGDLVIPVAYDRLEQDGLSVRAIQLRSESEGETVERFTFTPEGQLRSEQRLTQHFTVRVAGSGPQSQLDVLRTEQAIGTEHTGEWFYDTREDRWGLRRTTDGRVLIAPAFRYVRPIPGTALSLVGLAKDSPAEFERTSFRFEQAYGLVDHQIGAVVTDLDFLDIRFEDFADGHPVARCVFTNGRFGLINRSGRVIVEDYAFIGPFLNGRARASQTGQLSASTSAVDPLMGLRSFLDQFLAPWIMTDYTRYDQVFQRTAQLECVDCRWGYLNAAGEAVIPHKYDFAQDMANEVGIVRQDGKWGAIHADGRKLIPCAYDQVHFLEHTDNRILRVYVEKPKYGLIDTFGQLTIEANYDNIGPLSEGRLAVAYDGLWGFTNLEGQEIISCRFDEVKPFSEGLAAVRLGRRWGFVDRLGQVVIDFQYEDSGSFQQGLAWVKTTEGVGFIDPRGNLRIPPKYQEAGDFFQGVARVRQEDRWGLINPAGDWVQPPKYRDIQPFQSVGLAIVRYGRQAEKYGLIDQSGQLITTTAYRDIQPFHEGLAVVKDRDSYGYIDQTGKLVIPTRYSRAEPFQEGRAAVYLDGHCGYLDRLGRRQSDFSFSRCNPYEDGRAVVYKGLKRAGLLDRTGRLVLEPSVDRLLTFSEGRGLVRAGKYRFYYITEEADIHHGYYEKAGEFTHGVAVVRVDNKWGVINRRGIALIPPKYSRIGSFQDGYATVRVEGFSGLTTARGRPIVSPDFEYISYAGEGVFRVEQGDKVGYFNEAGDWIWSLEE